MSAADDIKTAWLHHGASAVELSRMAKDGYYRLRRLVPLPLPAVPFRDTIEPTKYCTTRIVEFHVDRYYEGGVPMYRVIGELEGTEVEVYRW